MKSIARCAAYLCAAALLCVNACSSTDSNPPPPAGSCPTSPTAATGSSDPACTACVKANCNAELAQKSGSGWASNYLGGDGTCAAFNGCECDCTRSSQNPNQLFTCVTTTCAAKLDAACQAAVVSANRCISDHCAATCR